MHYTQSYKDHRSGQCPGAPLSVVDRERNKGRINNIKSFCHPKDVQSNFNRNFHRRTFSHKKNSTLKRVAPLTQKDYY